LEAVYGVGRRTVKLQPGGSSRGTEAAISSLLRKGEGRKSRRREALKMGGGGWHGKDYERPSFISSGIRGEDQGWK